MGACFVLTNNYVLHCKSYLLTWPTFQWMASHRTMTVYLGCQTHWLTGRKLTPYFNIKKTSTSIPVWQCQVGVIIDECFLDSMLFPSISHSNLAVVWIYMGVGPWVWINIGLGYTWLWILHGCGLNMGVDFTWVWIIHGCVSYIGIYVRMSGSQMKRI